MVYAHTLALHSLIRWVIVLFGVVAVARAIGGYAGRKAWTSADGFTGLGFTVALDAQLVIGLILLLLLSPTTTLALQDPALAMRTHALRFWMVEHPVLMVAAVALAHLGRVRIRRQVESRLRHRAAALFFGLALLVALAGIPWPFLPYGRPWLPFM